MNMDYFILGMGISAPLALHQGDLAAVGAAFDRTVDVVPRMLAEPNQAPETVVELLSNSQLWPYLLGKGAQMAGVQMAAAPQCVMMPNGQTQARVQRGLPTRAPPLVAPMICR